MEYFHQKVNFQIFENGHFWGCDVENWVWAKLALWICPILWIRVKIGYTQLSPTFFDHYRPNRPIYQKIKKNHFFKKNAIFLVENLPEKGQNWFNSKTTIVPSPHEHSLQTYNNGFFISQHRFFRHFSTHTPKMAIFAMKDQTHKWYFTHLGCLNRVDFTLKYAYLNV